MNSINRIGAGFGLILGAAALVVVTGSRAEAATFVTARVPFSFLVQGHECPAGTYEIRRSDDGDVVEIRGTQTNAFAMSFVRQADGHDPMGTNPVLVFGSYENQHRLEQVWVSDAEGLELPATSHAHALAQSGPATNSVYVVAATRDAD